MFLARNVGLKTDEDYFKDEEFLELLEEYEQSVRNGSPVFMDADDLADIADYYQMEGKYDESQQAIDRALELEPKSVVALNYKIHVAIDQKDFNAAEDYLSQLVDHQLPEYVYSRAEIWIAQDETEKADDYLRKAFEDVPIDEYQDYVLDVANLYSDYDYNEKALEWMMRAKQENTDDFKELMGRTMFGLGKYDDSERIFNELIDRNPFQKRYWNALANTQFMKEDYGASVTSSEYAIAIDPSDAEGVLAKANGLYHLVNYEEALTYFERYSEIEPNDEYGFLNQGSCLINLERFEEAVEKLSKALEVAQDNGESSCLVEIMQELAFAYCELRMPETSLYYLEQTDEMDCNHSDMDVVKGHVMLASDRPEDAEEFFKKAIQASADAPHTLLRIIVSLYDNRYVEACYRMLQQLFSMVGDDWKDGYSYMALCCYDLKRDEDFLHYLKLACQRNQPEAQTVLSPLFPKGMPVEEFYGYMKLNLKG